MLSNRLTQNASLNHQPALVSLLRPTPSSRPFHTPFAFNSNERPISIVTIHTSPSSSRSHSSHVCSSTSSREYKLSDTPQGPKKRLAFFVSGGGSNFKAIHMAMQAGRIPHAEAVAVVSDVPSCGGIQYAVDQGIETLTYPIPKKGGFPGLTPDDLVTRLQELSVDYVILAGYLKLIPSTLVAAFPNRMLNIHPGLLPSFGGKGMYGENVHKAVVASGARFSGPTVHFVSEEFDTGPILAQRVVPVYPKDTPKQLAERVLKEEHIVYPEAVAALVSGRIEWRSDGIPMIVNYS